MRWALDVLGAVSWRRVFRARLYVRDSLWVLPLAGAVLGAVLGSVDIRIDQSVHVPPQYQYSASTATAVLAAIVGAMAALTGFVVTVTTLVVQMATGTFSARYMRLWYRDRMLKVLLGLLVGTLAFSFSLMRRVESNFVPNIGVTVAGVLVVVCLLVFLVFLDRYLHRLRPVAVAALVHEYFRRNFERQIKRATNPEIFAGVLDVGDEESTLAVCSPRAGAIQAVDADALVKWGHEHDCLVVLRHGIGDFVPSGAELINVYGDQNVGRHGARRLAEMVALGDERTIEQDPDYAPPPCDARGAARGGPPRVPGGGEGRVGAPGGDRRAIVRRLGRPRSGERRRQPGDRRAPHKAPGSCRGTLSKHFRSSVPGDAPHAGPMFDAGR